MLQASGLNLTRVCNDLTCEVQHVKWIIVQIQKNYNNNKLKGSGTVHKFYLNPFHLSLVICFIIGHACS